MLEKRQWARGLRSIFSVAAALALANCGNASDGTHPGAAGTSAESGASATGGSAGAGAGDGGAAGAKPASGGSPSGETGGSSGAGLAGASAAGAADAGASGNPDGAAGSGACQTELLTFTSPNAQHVSVCSVIDYPMNPPVYGDHYPVWAAYKSYTFPVPLGFLVHDLEHGAVVLLYNCPQGCAEEVALAQAFLDALPMDPRCTPEVKHQTILAPDPTLPKRWAAVAWGHSLTNNCFDSAAFRSFYDANVGHGPEDICSDGADLTSDACP